MKAKSPGFIPGGNWCICDVCGQAIRATHIKKRWDNLMVCAADWEPRQPQDYVRAVPDNQRPAINRPEPSDTFLSPGEVTENDL